MISPIRKVRKCEQAPGFLALTQELPYATGENIKKEKKKKMEFPLWCNGFHSILGALGHRSDPPPRHSGLRIWYCLPCSLGSNCSSDLITDRGTPNALGWPKKKREKVRRKRLRKQLVKVNRWTPRMISRKTEWIISHR